MQTNLVDSVLLNPSRQDVLDFEVFMRQQPQIELKVVERFCNGIYARELHIPAGCMLTGEIHKHENLNILLQGIMDVRTEDGIQRVTAPFTVVSPPGTKRIAFAHTDCIWTTFHRTDLLDTNKIKEFFIASSEQEYLEHCGQLKLLADLI